MIKKGFLKSHAGLFSFILRLIDVSLVAVVGVLAYYFSAAYQTYSAMGVQGLPSHYYKVVFLAAIATILTFQSFNIYRVWRGSSTLSEIKALTSAWFMVGVFLAVLAFFTKTGAEYSRSWMAIWFSVAWASFIVYRVLLRVSLKWMRSHGFNKRHIIVVGTGSQAILVSERLRESYWYGLEISALYGTSSDELPDWLTEKRLISELAELREYVASNSIDQVWIALPHSKESMIREVISALEDVHTEIRYVPDIFEYQLMHHSLSEVAGVPVVRISYSAIDGLNRFVKWFEDYTLSFILLVLASPLMLAIAIGVKLSSPGPVLYRQQRVGWNGKEFTMFKFRSMQAEAEKLTGPVLASRRDDRTTRFGAFLRKTSLDELPQLFNVLKGEMSLIGPRPERPVFVEKYKEEVPHYMKKHLAKAGVTGWAQVHGWRGNTCLHTRIEHDLYYIENWSLWLDVKIIIMTVFRGFIHKNAY